MPDMGIPILYALDRIPSGCRARRPRLDLVELGTPDVRGARRGARSRASGWLARPGRAGGAAPLVLNAANEVAVAAFLAGRCGFMEVPRLIGDALDAHAGAAADDLGACLALDAAVRRTTEAALGSIPAGSAVS